MSNSSNRRLVITAVLAGSSQSQVARTDGVSQGWISPLMQPDQDECQEAFEPRSRAPKNSPSATPEATVELVLQLRKTLSEAGLDAGADTIDWHLQHHHQITLSRATTNRILVRAGLVSPDPSQRPKAPYLRSEAEHPNETWKVLEFFSKREDAVEDVGGGAVRPGPGYGVCTVDDLPRSSHVYGTGRRL